MKKKAFGVLIGLVIVLAVGVNVFAIFWLEAYELETSDVVVDEIVEEEEGVVEDIQESESLFTLDEGMRVDYGSNPMVTYHDDEKLILAYEDRADQLYAAPGEGAPLIVTYDGLNFEEVEDRTGLSTLPMGVKIGELYYKYIFFPSEGVKLAISEDDVTYVAQDEIALEVYADGASDAGQFGVSTFFADDEGGMVLLYNSTNEDDDIVVNRAYASSDDLNTLTVVGEDILDETLEDEQYADPYTVTLDDGRIVLIIMNQTDGERPPHERQGTIHAYITEDYGESFEYAGQLMSWEDFEEFDVYSLNDPKIAQMEDGSLRVYVAAMLPDPESTNENPLRRYKWILVSAFGTLD